MSEPETMTRPMLFPTLAALAASGFIFRITDNGGATCDRYTVTFCDGDYLGMSGVPTHPQGFSQCGEGIDVAGWAERIENGEEVDLALGDLPAYIAEHVRHRLNQGFEDWLEAVVEKQPYAVARDRASVKKLYEGLHDDFGAGLYLDADDRYRVASDNGESDDHGPFDDAAEVLRSTLPTDYSLSGPEYHSTLDVARLEPDPEVAAAIKALEEAAGAKRFSRLKERR